LLHGDLYNQDFAVRLYGCFNIEKQSIPIVDIYKVNFSLLKHNLWDFLIFPNYFPRGSFTTTRITGVG
jgi:hypothetical protein